MPATEMFIGSQLTDISAGSLPAICGIDRAGQPRCSGLVSSEAIAGEPGASYKALATGGNSACFQRADETWFCLGQTLNLSFAACTAPLVPAVPLRELALGMFHGCGLTESGNVMCWDIDGAQASRSDLP
jgi:hypothetical protein